MTFWNSRTRYLVCKGSRGSKKSKTTALRLIVNMMSHPDANALVIRRYARSLRDSCFADLEWAIHRLGFDSDWRATVSPLEIVRISTGQKILFRGLDDGQKVTSVTVAQGVLCWVWCEEASQLESEAEFNKLDLSIRGQVPAGLWKEIVLTLNPWSETWWGKRRFFDKPNPEVTALTTTYLCNEYLDDKDWALFEDLRVNFPRRYRIEGLGEWGIAEGLIYPDAKIVSFDREAMKGRRDLKAFYGLRFYRSDRLCRRLLRSGVKDRFCSLGDLRARAHESGACRPDQGLRPAAREGHLRQRRTEKQKHLHLRGENALRIHTTYRSIETPPPAWRKLCRPADSHRLVGNTSTCVEKTTA